MNTQYFRSTLIWIAVPILPFFLQACGDSLMTLPIKDEVTLTGPTHKANQANYSGKQVLGVDSTTGIFYLVDPPHQTSEVWARLTDHEPQDLWPNGLAFDPATERLYFADDNSLYYITQGRREIKIPGFNFSGQIPSNATFSHGIYTFIGDQANRMYAVDPSAPILKAVCDLDGPGRNPLRLGDLVFDHLEDHFLGSSIDPYPSFFSLEVTTDQTICEDIAFCYGPVTHCGSSRQLAFAPDNSLIAHHSTGEFTTLDPDTGQTTATFGMIESLKFTDLASPCREHRILGVDAQTGHVYLVEFNSTFTTATAFVWGQMINHYPDGEWPNGLAFDPKTQRAYFAHHNNQLFYLEQGGTEVPVIDLEDHRPTNATFADGAYYFVGNGDQTLYRVDPETPKLDRVCVLKSPTGLQLGDIVFDSSADQFYASILAPYPGLLGFDRACHLTRIEDCQSSPDTCNSGSQLAYVADAILIRHHETSGQFTQSTQGIETLTLDGWHFSDLASAPHCR